MDLTRSSIQRPVFAWMLMVGLILFGLISFKRLGVSELPDVDFPVVSVAVALEGASPEIIESDVVDVIENAMMGVQGLRDITSTARYGSGSISLEFDLDRNIDAAVQEVQGKVAQLGGRLPRNMNPPVISKMNPEDQPIMWIALSGDQSPRELMVYARDKIATQFQLVPGVGEVFFGGFLEPNIRVWIDGNKLAQFDLSVDDVVAAIGSEHVELPAGNLESDKQEFTLRVIGEALSPEEFSRISITRRGGAPVFRPIKLGDVARVEAGLEDIRRKVRVLGENAIGMGIRKQRGTNAVEIADGVKAKLEALQKVLPKGLKLGVNFDSTKFIRESVNELQFELILSGILTAIICWLFLGSWSATFNVLIAIPTSLIGAFIGIKYFGFTLNTFTFLGLILAVGIVVDDAIMVLENIFRHRDMGKVKEVAALEGTHQVQFAAMATSLAIAAIFLPVAFMQGIIGKFFLQFGITITIAVAISLLEALTLTPMRCSQFMEKSHAGGRWMDRQLDRLMNFYARTLNLALNRRWYVLIVATALFVGSFGLLKFIRKEFSPAQDQGIFMVRMTTKVGSSLEFTDGLILKVEEKLKAIAEIDRYFVSVGGFGGTSQVNSGMAFITLKPRHERKRGQQDIMTDVRGQLGEIKELKSIIQDMSMRSFGSGRGFPIEFSVRGPDWDQLIKISKGFKDELSKDSRFVDLDSNLDDGLPVVRIVPKREKAAQLGVGIDKIANAVSYLVGGERVARFTEGGKRIDVRVKLDQLFRKDVDAILDIRVRNDRGELIRLGEVAEIDRRLTLASIMRQQRERSISVYSNVAPKASQAEMVKDLEKFREKLPQGYSLVLGGSSKAFGDTFSSLMFALWLGIAVAYMILASQFNSFIHGFTVLLAMPFSMTGAWLALWMGNQSLNMYSMIGLILLMGVVKKNSIMLVDFTNQAREGGIQSVREALLRACPLRVRPILMTSITIVASCIPPILGLGPGTETRAPMATAVVGGVIVSTLFTLYVVPCAYLVLSRIERRRHSAIASNYEKGSGKFEFQAHVGRKESVESGAAH